MVWRTALRILPTPCPRSLAARLGRLLASAGPSHPPASCAPSAPWKSPPARPLQLCSARCAGHNKWSKVKHVKGSKDEARSKTFARLAVKIKMAVKEGGSNPDLNGNLAQILEQCRANHMPKLSIENTIKKATKPLSQQMFEARGPGGCLLIIEVLTDNISLCHHEIKHLLAKNGAMLSEGARRSFSQRGVVAVPARNVSMERALELAIEVGAEDVKETEDEEGRPVLQFISDMRNTRKVGASLEDLGMQITSSGLELFPQTLISLNQAHLDAASALIEALNDSPDTVRVWDNIQADS
ncbi:translational activator of cytochrome c oxidase 1-like [Brachionichthys hirsutus]|uniref:translational activator of cytochrome c oxidase 1-like n=1 Tax=Brachionichthys hirsutus TaxID=412623 RepID=UPI00360454FE